MIERLKDRHRTQVERVGSSSNQIIVTFYTPSAATDAEIEAQIRAHVDVQVRPDQVYLVEQRCDDALMGRFTCRVAPDAPAIAPVLAVPTNVQRADADGLDRPNPYTKDD